VRRGERERRLSKRRRVDTELCEWMNNILSGTSDKTEGVTEQHVDLASKADQIEEKAWLL
jgi:hypothetical protein